jgi:hypothetical protein
MRGRYYDPQLARFISRDPSGLSGGTNMYEYAGDDPVDFSDPTGEMWGGIDTGGWYGPGTDNGEYPGLAGWYGIGVGPGTFVYQGLAALANMPGIDNDVFTFYDGSQNGGGIFEAQVRQTLPIPPLNSNPAIPPGPEWSWVGKGSPGSDEGSWLNRLTRWALHPDFSHGMPKGPHYDLQRRDVGKFSLRLSGTKLQLWSEGTNSWQTPLRFFIIDILTQRFSAMMIVRKLRQKSLAQKYLTHKLSPQRPTTLDKLIRTRNDFAVGDFFSALPDSVPSDAVSEFASDIPGFDYKSATALLTGVVREFLYTPGGTVLLENYLLEDPSRKEYETKHRVRTLANERYWELKRPKTLDYEIDSLVADWAVYFPYVGYFYISRSDERSVVLSDAELDSVTTNLIGVAVDAFDGNSFLLWWREDLFPLATLRMA